MEECILTKKLLPDDKIVLTGEGPVGIFVWGRRPIKTDAAGLALMPVDFLPRLRAALGRDPEADTLEDGGKCLQKDKT